MQYAVFDHKQVEAFPGGKGICPICSAATVAKCGPRVMHHWAHASRRDCDPWWENETPWHREWKNLFPAECREIAYTAPSGEVHRADIVTPTGIVIEIQHSAMNDVERLSREAFYQNLIWIVDGSTFMKNFAIHHKLPDPTSELAKDLEWFPAGIGLDGGSNRGLFERRSQRNMGMRGMGEIREQVNALYCGHHQYVWKRPRSTWLDATCPVYIDFGDDELIRLQKYEAQPLPCVFRTTKRQFLHDAMREARTTDVATTFKPMR